MKTYNEYLTDNLNKLLKNAEDKNQEAESSLFSLRTIRPNNTDSIKFVLLGPLLGKMYFNKFKEAVKKDMDIVLDDAVYGRMCVEVSTIDDKYKYYIEMSLNKICQLPIAGNQLHILKRDAEKYEMCLEGYVNSLNFILNDERNFN